MTKGLMFQKATVCSIGLQGGMIVLTVFVTTATKRDTGRWVIMFLAGDELRRLRGQTSQIGKEQRLRVYISFLLSHLF
jgi:hypothetical protein